MLKKVQMSKLSLPHSIGVVSEVLKRMSSRPHKTRTCRALTKAEIEQSSPVHYGNNYQVIFLQIAEVSAEEEPP